MLSWSVCGGSELWKAWLGWVSVGEGYDFVGFDLGWAWVTRISRNCLFARGFLRIREISLTSHVFQVLDFHKDWFFFFRIQSFCEVLNDGTACFHNFGSCYLFWLLFELGFGWLELGLFGSFTVDWQLSFADTNRIPTNEIRVWASLLKACNFYGKQQNSYWSTGNF